MTDHERLAAAYDAAVVAMEKARTVANAAFNRPDRPIICGNCCGVPSPNWVEFMRACAARDEARRSLAVDEPDPEDVPIGPLVGGCVVVVETRPRHLPIIVIHDEEGLQ